MNNDILEIMLSEEELNKRIKEIAEQIDNDFRDKDFAVITILKGSYIFSADLVRNLKSAPELDFMTASSYVGTNSTGIIKIIHDIRIDIKDKNVIIVEDIVDTGRTLALIKEEFLKRGAADVKICTLLNKPQARVVPVDIDYEGFEIENKFVVGFGLDCDEKYRNLPYVGVLKPEVYGG